MGRKSKKKSEAQAVAERAAEIKGQARVLADEGGEAMKEFASTTGVAAKEFAHTAFEAAKDLLETVEKAGQRLEKESKPARKRGRKLLKAGVAIGAGVFIATNEKARGAIAQLIGRGGGGAADPWETTEGEGFTQTPVPETPATTEPTS